MALESSVWAGSPSVMLSGTFGSGGRVVVVVAGAEAGGGTPWEPAASAAPAPNGQTASASMAAMAPTGPICRQLPLRYNPIGLEHDIRDHHRWAGRGELPT